MALPLYLAQTPWEMTGNLPDFPAYMACHFSSGGQSLSNLPKTLPPGAMLILDDSMPMDDHDPLQILAQLTDLLTQQDCESLLLDFQRPQIPAQQELAKLLCDTLPCPVGVTELYAGDLPCPVFLPPAPPDMPLSDYLAPWKGRDIWLEAALDGMEFTLTERGCTATPLPDFPESGFPEEKLHCHYRIQRIPETAIFQIWRTPEDLRALLSEAEGLGVSRAIGLWQELRMQKPGL